MPVLMVITIMAIAAFQVYWLKKAYEREKRTLEMRTNYLFRETVFQLQGSKLQIDKIVVDSSKSPQVIIKRNNTEAKPRQGDRRKMITMADVISKKLKDTASKSFFIRTDTSEVFTRTTIGKRNRIMQFLFEMDSLQDSVTVFEIEKALRARLEDQGIEIPFSVSRTLAPETDERNFNQVSLGFSSPVTYKIIPGNTMPYVLNRIIVPIVFSVFLVAFTFLSFMVLYRNMIKQKKLADIKNEFISNITHELKTPIATVSVAIEALRSFNAKMDPSKSKEYLDISANELQRLSLLVDKVLKLSMFEKKEVELVYEPLDMKALVEEVTSSMRLQFENRQAEVNVHSNGITSLEGDRLHLVSVIFNMLDNALKYSPATPLIDILIEGDDKNIKLTFSDKGMGIPQEYRERVFEKFFRVPNGNLHNTKGYGLGLSYVSHVINKHKGSIKVDSEAGEGCRFIILLPRNKT